MIDFDVQRFTRRCAASGRELRAGETYFSVLKREGSEMIRLDYAADAWNGAPDDAIGVWKGRIPDPSSTKVHWAPNDVMLDYLEKLEADPSRIDTRYVLALLLLRRRVLRWDDTEETERHRVMVMDCPRKEKQYRIIEAGPSPERVQTIQAELAQLLFADQDHAEAEEGSPP